MRVDCFLLSLFFWVLFVEAKGQETKEIHHNSQFWWSLNTSTRITEGFGVVADFHLRTNDFVARRNFYFARAGLAFWASDKLTLVGGYAHLWLARPVGDTGFAFQDENRVYQQAQWRQKEGRVTFLHRIRNEQRWHQVLNDEGTVLRTRFSDRVRFLFSIVVPIIEKEYFPALTVADEMHIHFGKEIINNTFDQNRVFVGIKQRITPNLSFDFGYMMVYQQRFSGFEYDMNHTLRWFFYYSPDLRKQKKGPHYSIPGDE